MLLQGTGFAQRARRRENGAMPLTGEYAPSTSAWSRAQTELYEATNGEAMRDRA
jgi:hypothetical protein